jgi:hypothetical protein
MRPEGNCVVLANVIDRQIRIQSFHMQTPTNVRIVDEPCTETESPFWTDELSSPVTTCVSGTVLEGKDQSPRHGCSLRLVRSEGLSATEKATLVVEVTGKCSATSSHTCSWPAYVSWTVDAESAPPSESPSDISPSPRSMPSSPPPSASPQPSVSGT